MVDIVIEGKGKNALGTAVMTRLLEQIRAAGDAPLLVRGAGDAFSAGLDLREVTSLSGDGMAAFLRLLEELFSTLYQHPAPTVALVNGHAIAGGAILALCCDVRVAKDDPSVKIGLNETAIGVVIPPRTLAIVRGRLGALHETEVVLGAGLHAPARARELGLVDEVAADAEAVARARLATLAAHPRAAYAFAKRLLRGDTPEALAPAALLDRYLVEAVPLWSGAELKARMARFIKG